ncbi:MAG TPA: hypothetical protein PKA64_02700 [Myxococcota bacterium]|nr:hypothetical protein [Myxococcota bacterium]
MKRVVVTGRGAAWVFLAVGLGAAGVGFAEDPGVQATVEVSSQVSLADIEANTPKWVAEMHDKLKGLERLDEQSRRGASGEPLECVSTNLDQARSLTESSDLAAEAIQAALSRGDMARASFEYRKIAIAVKNVRRKYDESERCAAGEGQRDGRTRRQITGEPANADDDTRGLPDDVTDWGFDPPDASPF